MGVVAKEEHAGAYRALRRAAAASGAPVLVLVAASVDGVCALHVLGGLLRGDMVPHRVVPVAGYDDVAAEGAALAAGRSAASAVVMLDCGATADVGALLPAAPAIYVADSHRPYALANVGGGAQVRVLDDGFVAANADMIGAAASYASRGADAADDSGSESDGADAHAAYVSAGAWRGTSAARLVYDVAAALGRDSNDGLWCAVVGATAQHVLELVPPDAYAAEADALRERVLQLNRADAGGRGGGAALAVPVADAAGGLASADASGGISCAPDFRFLLARHWTLFDAMLHSRYMATRLGAWRERGRKLLETLVARMGVPLAQTQRDWASMAAEVKDALPGRLARHAPEFGLGDVSFPSFVRSYGYVLRLSAADAVHALSALVEAPAAETDRRAACAANVFSALGALGSGAAAVARLRAGIAAAIAQQRALLHEAALVLSHRQLRYGRRLRHAVLRHTAAGAAACVASHPLALAKLALFLRDATAASPHGRTPLVLAAAQAAPPGTFLVVAAAGSADAQDERGAFGVAFRRAAQDVRARVRHDGFDAAAIEVRGEDLRAFLHALQRVL